MELVIITGMSGAGKSAALKFLEDYEYYCIDNLPPILMSSFVYTCLRDGSSIDKIAIGLDIRSEEFFYQLDEMYKELDNMKIKFKIIFLDANDDILIRRFKETRRNHPLGSVQISKSIAKERLLLQVVKGKATEVIDTTHLLTRELKELLLEILHSDKKFDNLMISVNSFGFKYGIPIDSDLVFDVRFMGNPHYIPELQPLTGNDKEVQDFVMEQPQAIEFLHKLEDMIDFLIPNYKKEGKNLLVVNIGCTGGKHRSVTIANKLFDHLISKGHSVIVKHTDVEKNLKNY